MQVPKPVDRVPAVTAVVTINVNVVAFGTVAIVHVPFSLTC